MAVVMKNGFTMEMTNDEFRMTKECSNDEAEKYLVGTFEYSSSVRHSSLVRHSSFFFNLPAPRKDPRLHAGGLGFLDLVVAHVEHRQARPGELVVRTQFGGLQSRLDRLHMAAGLHERHAECVPGVEI